MPFSTLIIPLGVMAGLAVVAASIPIIIHLLHRQRTQPILWGAMQFLLESPLQQRRRKKVDHWLLMLLRILLMLVIVALLAWPRQKREWSLLGSGSGGGGTDIAFVIDRSLSTGRHTGNSTVFQESVNAIDQFVKSGNLKPTDTISVILAEHQPRKLTQRPFPASDAGRVVNELRKMKPGSSDGPIPDAVAAAREVLTRGRNGRKAIIVLSDDQRTGWKIQNTEAWNAALGQRVKGVEPDVKLYQMGITADAQAGNVTVADLIVPPLVGTARPVDIRATVINNGKKDVPAQTAKLLINGKQVAKMPVQALQPGVSAPIRFEHTFSDPHSNSVEVRVDAADGLDQDNAAVASAYVWQQLPVLIVDGQLTNTGPISTISDSTFRTFKGAQFLLNAMLSDAANPDAPPLIKPTIVSVSDSKLSGLKLDDYAAVVFNDVPQLPSAMQAKLLDYARSGHGLWFILGKNSERGFIGDGLSQAGLMRLEVNSEQAATDKAPSLDVREPGSAMLLSLATPDNKVLTGVDTFKWWAVKARDPDAKVIVAAAGSNDPLIIDRPIGSNGGRVVVWTTGVDKSWNNWPAATVFAPMVNITLYHLAGGQTKGMENRRLESGQPIVWTGAATPAAGRIELTRPDGSKVEKRAVTRDSRQIFSYNETYLPGRYEIRFPDQTAIPQPVYYGVGIDRTELDETALNDDDRKWLTADDHKFVEAQLDSSRGLVAALGGAATTQEKLWPWLAAFVLVTLLGETYLTYRMIKRQSVPGADVIPGAAVA